MRDFFSVEGRIACVTGASSCLGLAPATALAEAAAHAVGVVDGVGYEGTRAQASAHARPGGAMTHVGLGSAMGGPLPTFDRTKRLPPETILVPAHKE